VFHLWRGRTPVDLPIYVLTGIIGFFLGQTLGDVIGLNVMLVGPIHVIEATVVSLTSLFFIYWLKIK